MEQAYDFGEGFQIKILALIIRDPTFFTIYRDVVKPQYFESEIHVDIARIVCDFYDQFQTSPTKESLIEEVNKLCNTTKVKKNKRDQYVETVEKLYEVDLSDAAYVKDRAVEFGRRQAMIKAIFEAADDLKNKVDFEKIKKRIEDAGLVGLGVGDFGLDYFENIPKRIEETWGAPPTERVPTGIEFLDEIMEGGLARKELGIVIAPPGTGKSLTLTNLGAYAVLRGFNVFHFTFEMSSSLVAKRYDMRVTGKTTEYLSKKKNWQKVIEALNMFNKLENRGQLYIKEYPTRTCTPDMIRSYLTKIIMTKNIRPDLIILDYPDIMKPSRGYAERRHELEVLYEDIRAIASEFNCAIWGASQANRGSLSKKTVTIADLAESFAKAAVCDFAIAISQTREEKSQGRLRYFVAKHRTGRDNETVCCKVDYPKMTVKFDPEFQEEFQAQESEYFDDSGEATKKKRKKKTEKQERNGEDSVMQAVMEHVVNS